jgi:hypothetical protein
MPASVLAVGLDPASVDFSATPELTGNLVRAFIDSQLQRLRDLGYEVHGCLIDPRTPPPAFSNGSSRRGAMTAS